MREIIALSVGLILVGIGVYVLLGTILADTLTTKKTVAGALLIFAGIAAGLAVMNYDVLRKVHVGIGKIEIETARKEIAVAKDEAIKEINKEVEIQKENLKQIALAFTKITWLKSQTKSEFGTTDRLSAANTETVNEMNRLLELVLPDSVDRAKWIEALQQTLPPRH